VARRRDSTWVAVKQFALSLPGAWEDHPWEETVVKVNKKIFLFLGRPDGEPAGIGVKLVDSHGHAMSVEGAAPSGYGLGKAGWVSVPLVGEAADPELVCEWVEESYRNIATKTLVKELDARSSA
jgi:predicted DNA-binding protein (MmcQ/YjbR family)